jgi:hypothetical protein
MEEKPRESIFEERRKPKPTTEAGVSIANVFGNQRLNKAEQQGLASPAQPREEIEPAIDTAGLQEDLNELAHRAKTEPRQLGEEI